MLGFWSRSPQPEQAVDKEKPKSTEDAPAIAQTDAAPPEPAGQEEPTKDATVVAPGVVSSVDSAVLPSPSPAEEQASPEASPANVPSADVVPADDKPQSSPDPEQSATPFPTTADHLSPTLPESDSPRRARRLSFRSFAFFYGRDKQPVEHITNAQHEKKEEAVQEALKERKLMSSRNTKKVDKTAFALRNLILGPGAVPIETQKASAKPKPKPAGPDTLHKVNGQLLTPKQANKVIAKLRTLPLPDGPDVPDPSTPGLRLRTQAEGPIHAVCLDCTEEEADKLHFARLATSEELQANAFSRTKPPIKKSEEPANIATADITSVVPVLRDVRIITLVASPDFGFGHPPDADGILAGSVPSAGAFSDGLKEITGQLMALGFATSKAVLPDHTGVHPPIDRMSVLTYWWGLEVCLPPPTMVYLGNVKSIQNAALNFLTTFSLFSNGVKEILPFVRYIAQFLDFEWGAIKAQDKGEGVVCAATWVMPAALVPRPWDFSPPPPEKTFIPKQSNPLPSSVPKSTLSGPTVAFPGSKQGIFTPDAPDLPPVMITPPTLPRHAVPPAQLLEGTRA